MRLHGVHKIYACFMCTHLGQRCETYLQIPDFRVSASNGMTLLEVLA